MRPVSVARWIQVVYKGTLKKLVDPGVCSLMFGGSTYYLLLLWKVLLEKHW